MLEQVNEGVKIHDLLRQMAWEKLGDEIVQTHKALLQAYANTKTGDGWHTAPDDGYLYDHLAYHLEHAERKDELINLLLDFSWLQTKLDKKDVQMLLSDFDYFNGFRPFSSCSDYPTNDPPRIPCFTSVQETTGYTTDRAASPK